MQIRAETLSLFVLSQLELQNLQPELPFEVNLDERILVLIKTLEETSAQERVFSWEMAPPARKAKSLEQLRNIFLLGLFLLIASYFK